MANWLGPAETERASGRLPAYGCFSGALGALALGDGSGEGGEAPGESAQPVWLYRHDVAGAGESGRGSGASRRIAEVDCAGTRERSDVRPRRRADPVDL